LIYIKLSDIFRIGKEKTAGSLAMKDSLKPGLTFEFKFKVPESKTVPHLYPESPEFQVMPRVLATGFMVGLFEWACIQAINPHIDWPDEQTVGIQVNLSHLAATPPGLTVTVKGKLEEVEGRKLSFSIVADDGVDTISRGRHDRFVIDAAKFNAKMAAKGESELVE
jgi:fluoroacetyl-CoA thioesterase